jgi:squalene cyclase
VREQQLVVLEPGRGADYPLSPGYAPGEHHFAYDYARTPDSLAARWFSDAETERALDFLAAEQDQDGGWPVRWRDWVPGTRLEWRPIVTIEALRTLHAYGRGI